MRSAQQQPITGKRVRIATGSCPIGSLREAARAGNRVEYGATSTQEGAAVEVLQKKVESLDLNKDQQAGSSAGAISFRS